MPSFEDLAADNPNIREQYDEWRRLRSQNARTRQTTRRSGSTCWPCVRGPEEQEIGDFVGADFKAAHRSATA